MLLAIDTATHFAGLALWDENRVWAEETWYSRMKHSVELMPRIQRMLDTCKVDVETLSGIGVSLGPGSFTGLRIGLAAAKGMALPHGFPLIGVSTLDVTAFPYQRFNRPVWAVIQAGRGRIGVACYDLLDGSWTQVVTPTLTTFEGLFELATPPAIFVGEIDEPSAEQLRQQMGEGIKIPPPSLRTRRAACLAELAARRLENDDVDDAATLTPFYLQTPEGKVEPMVEQVAQQ